VRCGPVLDSKFVVAAAKHSCNLQQCMSAAEESHNQLGGGHKSSAPLAVVDGACVADIIIQCRPGS
jgi:hypothetical protein